MINQYVYEYVQIKEIRHSFKEDEYECINYGHNQLLGIFKINQQWNEYCFYPTQSIVIDSDCLGDIYSFLIRLKKKEKK